MGGFGWGERVGGEGDAGCGGEGGVVMGGDGRFGAGMGISSDGCGCMGVAVYDCS